MESYLVSKEKRWCSACEACSTVCPVFAIHFERDEEGFRYPVVNKEVCINCKACLNVCVYELSVDKNKPKLVWGGYHKNELIKNESTSGGAFTALTETWCDENFVIFGAAVDKLNVFHTWVEDKGQIDLFRKSKYSQSIVGMSYKQAKKFLQEGKKVLFSGTPCQIAGLRKYLGSLSNSALLLTIEVVCEGFPSPILLEKYVSELETKYKSKITEVDYRYKDGNRWDFQVMRVSFENGQVLKTDRWVSPFWIFWSDRLMSRPSCISCPFRCPERVGDITLGDLWGVHKYCPELYGNNGGSSLVVCCTEKGERVLKDSLGSLYGHSLRLEDALQYQRPMRVAVPANPKRAVFMQDLRVLSYTELCRKWKPHHPLKFLVSKYLWGTNKQVVQWWKIRNRIKNLKLRMGFTS